MHKKEFLALAADLWEDLDLAKSKSTNLYDYEKALDELLVHFGCATLEGTLGQPSKDRRVKKNI